MTYEVESLTMPYGYIRQERVNLTEKYCVHSQIISQNSPCANRICTVAVVQQLLHKDFALTEKVTAVVHDQAANMELSLEILNRDLGWESLHCSAHCLQLCLKAGLSISAIDRLIGAARKLVGHFNHSVIAAEELKRRQAQMQIREKKLVQEVVTRWNSSFYMLERLLQMRWPVSAVLSDEQVTKCSDRCLDLKSE